MSDATQIPTQQTLGQRIDAVLSPLYAEAEQHRAALEQAKTQIKALQQQVDTATQGLAGIEDKMAEVVRSLASQDPVLAAVVGAPAPAGSVATSSPAPGTSPPSAEPVSPPATPTESQSATDAADIVAAATTPAPPAQPAADEPTGEPEPVPLDLDPEADQAMVDEASELLAGTPAGTDEEQAPAAPTPPPDIAAAAERAAAAAKQLQEKATGAE